MLTTSNLTFSGLADPEVQAAVECSQRLTARRTRNTIRDIYYRGREKLRDLGIALPPEMRSVECVIGWPAMAVETVEERLDIDGFVMPDGSVGSLGLDGIWADNHLDVEVSQAHIDAMVFGVDFLTVSTGDDGDPHPLITVESPLRMSGRWDARQRRLTAAYLERVDDDGRLAAITLFLADSTVRLAKSSGAWKVVDREDHMLGEVAVVPLINRPRSSRRWGASEITRPVMSLTDSAVRTLLGMEVAREFYSSPQRWMMGADEAAFVGPDGTPKTPWQSYLGRFLALGRDENGELPTVGQFPASSPEPYFGQVRVLAGMCAAEMAVPVTYMGFHTDNPPGGDGIRASEARLVKRAERRQTQYGRRWAQVMRLAVLIRDGEAPPEMSRLSTIWRDAGTPTRAATTDAVVKQVQSGVLPPTSDVTFELLGYPETTRQRLASDARRERATATVRAIAAASQSAAPAPAAPTG